MPALFRPTSLLIILWVLAACKVEIEPGVGGAVVNTDGNFACYAGENCALDVTDTTFDQTFEAVPADGYEFAGWVSRARGFCGSRATGCRLFTTTFGSNAALLSYLANDDLTFYLTPEFRYLGDPDSDTTYIGVDDAGNAFGIATPDGELVWAERTDEGYNAVYAKLTDGRELHLRFGADGMPESLTFDGLFIRFRQFTDTALLIDVVDAAGNGVPGALSYDDTLFAIISELRALAPAQAEWRSRRVAGMSGGSNRVSAASTVSAEAAEDLKAGVEAVQLAQQILASNSLRPLIDDAASTALDKLTNAVANHLEAKAEQQTTIDLQLRVLAGAGACYLSIAGGGLLKIATGLPGCEAFVKASYAVANSWAVEVANSRFKNTLDALRDQAPLYDAEFAQTASNKLVPTREIIGDYRHDIAIDAPAENAFVRIGESLAVRAVVTDRVTEAPVSRSRTIEVDYVDFAVDKKRYLRVDRRGASYDEAFGSEGPQVSIAPIGDRPARTEGLLEFRVSNLPEGRNPLRVMPTTLGIHSSKTVNVIATPYTPPFKVSVSGLDESYPVGETVSVEATLVDADGTTIPEAALRWLDAAGAELAASGTLARRFDAAGEVSLRAVASYYDVEFDDAVSLDIGEPSVTGTWAVRVLEDARGCEEGTAQRTLTVSLEQNGSSLTILGYPASISGRVISWNGVRYPDGNGTTTSSGSLTLAEDYNSLSGTENWSYSEPGYSCSGITYIAADRM